MNARTHDELVKAQYGGTAADYLVSAVHAAGEDLSALAALAKGRGDARVLDMGTGGGHVAYALAPHVAEMVAYDLSPDMLAVVAKSAAERGLTNVTTQQGRAESLPFADDSFDMAVSRYSAHHWGDFDAGLREAARVVKPCGVVAFCDVVTPGRPALDTFFQAIEILRDTSHVRNRSRAEWDDSAARAGLIGGTTSAFRIRIDFAAWIARMRTPPVMEAAIRALQAAASADVRRHFAIEADGSFAMDTALFTFRKPG